jgi:hypothetical protein
VESEAPDWETVRAAILKLDLCDDPIGRYAPTLLSLPVNRWEEPLRKYAELAYTELNSLPSFGKGKVGSIQQVFFSIYGLLDERQQSEHLSVTIRPRFVSEVERWIHQILTGTELPSVQTIRRRFLKPIFDQIEVDGREDLRRIGELRLGPPSRILDELGREFGVTRERARQRLVEIAMILKVRWPEGEYLLDDLSDRVAWLSPGGQQSARIDAAYELFYPVRRTRRFTSSRGHAPRDDGPSEGKERTSPRNHEGESVLPLRRSRRASSGSSSQ